jgi:S1-C subfamily serine protease
MFHRTSSRAVFPALVALFVAAPVRADKLTKAEIGKLGKAATAFIEVPGRGSGTGFCVHSSGLFITNEHVIRGRERQEIKVVLDAGLATQHVMSATVVRIDKDRDLALLRVTTKDKLPSLALGSVDGVTELMDVVAFGFPLGAALSPDEKQYPAMSVNAGNVSALRLKEGELQFIQVDVSVTFGSSGGPVLDDNGKVIGVIVSGVPGQRGINLAIPVNHVQGFLAAPDIQFAPPELKRETLDKPQEFKAKVVSVLPGAKEPSVKLTLQAGDEKPREFPMTKRDGEFVATAVPVLKKTADVVDVSIRMSGGTVSGQIANIEVKAGDKAIKLSQIRKIESKPKPRVLFGDGTAFDGVIPGLDAVEVSLGDTKLKLDLSKASQVLITPPVEINSVGATLVVSVDGKEIKRVESTIWVRDVMPTPVNPAAVNISPPAVSEDKVVKRLPEAFSDVSLGGGGRYLIFHLPRAHKLAVFDVSEAKITHYIPVAEDEITFSAGLDKLVIGLPKKGVLERWSLETFERELTVYPESSEGIKKVRLGYASQGPLSFNSTFLDLSTLKPSPISFTGGHGWTPTAFIYISGDGKVYCRWGEEAQSFVLEGDKLIQYREGGFGHVIPGPDGTTVFTTNGIATSTLKRADPDDAKLGYCIPAVTGKYFLSLTDADRGKGGTIAVHLLGYRRPLAKPENIEHGLRLHGDSDRETAFGAWKRIYFIPQANVIAILPVTNDQVVLHKFDIDAALEKSGVDYLFVTSQAPTTVKAGATVVYAMAVKAKRAPVTFKIDSGPKGMQVSKDGVVTWRVPPDEPEGNQEVILTVRDAGGQEAFHTFTLRVVK